MSKRVCVGVCGKSFGNGKGMVCVLEWETMVSNSSVLL